MKESKGKNDGAEGERGVGGGERWAVERGGGLAVGVGREVGGATGVWEGERKRRE